MLRASVAVSFGFILLLLKESDACSEIYCASVVSKCMLTQACRCDINRNKDTCPCCEDCTKCLGDHYNLCCNCFGMCEDSVIELDLTESQIGDLRTPFPQLFKTIAEQKDEEPQWTSYTFPAGSILDGFGKGGDKVKNQIATNSQDGLQGSLSRNCSVVYRNDCLPAVKCKEFCDQIGASAYRYFFNGCCECVGENCINYGINEIRCLNCDKLTLDDSDNMPLTNHVDEENFTIK